MNIFSILSALRGLAIGFFSPIWIIHLNDQGFDLLAIGILGTVFEVARLLFEIPTGTFADNNGVRRSIMLSYIFSMATWLIFPFIGITWVCVIAMIIWALAEALISGAFETWMSQVTPKEEFSKRLMRNAQVLIASIILTSLLSGHIYKFNSMLPFIFVALIYAIMLAIILIYLKSDQQIIKNQKKNTPKESFIEITGKSFQIVFKHRRILNVVLAGFFAALSYDVIMRYWQPYLIQIGNSKEFLGYVMAIAGVLAFILLHFTAKAHKIIEKNTLLSLIMVESISILMIFSTAFGLKAIGLVAISFLLSVEDIRNPIVNGYLNKFFPDSYKATLFSVNSVTGAAGEILSGIIFGLIAVKFGIIATFIVAAIFLIPSILLYYNTAQNTDINYSEKRDNMTFKS